MPHLRQWPFKKADKIKVRFSNKTSIYTAFTLKNDGNMWRKINLEDKIDDDFTFDPIHQQQVPDIIKFSIGSSRPKHSGDYWCEAESKTRTLPSAKVKLLVKGI